MADVVLDVTADDETAKGLDSAKGSFLSFGKVVMGAATGIGTALAGAFAFDKVTDFFGGAMASAQALRMETVKLDAVLKASGEAAGFNTQQMGQMADQMEAATGINKDLVTRAQAMASTFKNVRGEQFERTISLAGDLAAIMGNELPDAAQMFAEAINSPIDGMSILESSGVVLGKSQRRMVEDMMKVNDVVGAQKVLLDAVENSVGGTAEAVHAARSPYEKFWERLDKIKREIGEGLLPILDMVTPAFDWLAESAKMLIPIFKESLGMVVDFGKGVWDALVPVFEFVRDGAAVAFAAFDTVIEDWQELAEAAMLSFGLVAVSTFNDLVHMLGTVVPTYVKFFAKNWSDVLGDMVNFTATVLGNIGNNLFQFFKQVTGWLRGEGFDFQWTGLTEGFQRSLDDLPKIADRNKGLVESAMEKRLADLKSKTGESFTARFTAYQDAFGNIFKPAATKAADEVIADKEKTTGKYEQKEDATGQSSASSSLEELSKKISDAASGRASSTPESKATDKVKRSTDEVKGEVAKQTELMKTGTAETNEILRSVVTNLRRGLPAVAGP